MNDGLRRRRRYNTLNEEVSPLEGAINIVDAMLVFACGLMLSLVIRWNVDLVQPGNRIDVQKGQEVTENTNIREDLTKSEGKGQLYEKMGTVYKDPHTGKLFLLTE